jgi:hypothetical protein
VTQGEAFYMTELLARLQGLERGPAGNTSLAAAFALAQELSTDQIVIVQETEYTGAGKHPNAQLAFARTQGIAVSRGDPADERPGTSIVIPDHPSRIRCRDLDLDELRRSYLRGLAARGDLRPLGPEDAAYLSAETRWPDERVRREWDAQVAAAAAVKR